MDRLDAFSSFPFESFLSKLKRRIKKTSGIFKQAVNELINIRFLYSRPTSLELGLYFSDKPPNNCAILSNFTFIIVKKVESDGSVCGNMLKFHRSIYSYPYSSKTLAIGYYKERPNVLRGNPISKSILIPYDDTLSPLLLNVYFYHTFKCAILSHVYLLYVGIFLSFVLSRR